MRRKRGSQLQAGREAEAPLQRDPTRWPGGGRWVPFRVPEPPPPTGAAARSGQTAMVRLSFQRMVSDETMRIELGRDVVAALALENLDLSTPANSEAVRLFIVAHRAG